MPKKIDTGGEKWIRTGIGLPVGLAKELSGIALEEGLTTSETIVALVRKALEAPAEGVTKADKECLDRIVELEKEIEEASETIEELHAKLIAANEEREKALGTLYKVNHDFADKYEKDAEAMKKAVPGAWQQGYTLGYFMKSVYMLPVVHKPTSPYTAGGDPVKATLTLDDSIHKAIFNLKPDEPGSLSVEIDYWPSTVSDGPIAKEESLTYDSWSKALHPKVKPEPELEDEPLPAKKTPTPTKKPASLADLVAKAKATSGVKPKASSSPTPSVPKGIELDGTEVE